METDYYEYSLPIPTPDFVNVSFTYGLTLEWIVGSPQRARITYSDIPAEGKFIFFVEIVEGGGTKSEEWCGKDCDIFKVLGELLNREIKE